MSTRTALASLLAATLLDVAGARALDALGLIEGLLSPNGARLWLLVPLAALFYAARLCALFVAPGLALGALLVTARAHVARGLAPRAQGRQV